MIILSPVESGKIELEKGFFISSEMAGALSKELTEGRLKLTSPIYPVHPPYDGLLRMNFGDHDHLKVDERTWVELGLPAQYNGENLNAKRLIVFPMHGLGDQLYLAVAIRALAETYPGLSVTMVKPSIASAEQWYPMIYFEPWFQTTGPVVNVAEMAGFDYYLNAEHFAHIEEYKGTYPPEFYIRHFFKHDPDLIKKPLPVIVPYTEGASPNGKHVNRVMSELRDYGKPLVFVNPVSTGRVRDFPLKMLVRFIDSAKGRYSFLVSTFKRPEIDKAIRAINATNVETTENMISNVRDLIEIIHRCDMVITADSGITHLAEALDTPCGTVFNVVSPEERVIHYRYTETLQVDFKIPGTCRTPCYVHALKDGDLCPGMFIMNEKTGMQVFYDYPPCVAQLEGTHILQLLDALYEKFGDMKRNKG